MISENWCSSCFKPKLILVIYFPYSNPSGNPLFLGRNLRGKHCFWGTNRNIFSRFGRRPRFVAAESAAAAMSDDMLVSSAMQLPKSFQFRVAPLFKPVKPLPRFPNRSGLQLSQKACFLRNEQLFRFARTLP